MRFRVIDYDDDSLIAAGITNPDLLPGNRGDYDYRNSLWDFKDPQNPVLIDIDGGEPEDQSFYRDWRWVPDLLNKLDKEISVLEKKLVRTND